MRALEEVPAGVQAPRSPGWLGWASERGRVTPLLTGLIP